MARFKKHDLKKDVQYSKQYREEVLSTIKDYYSKGVVSKSVRDMKVDKHRYEQGEKWRPTSDILRIYNKYNIPYYPTKSEFMKSRQDYEMTDKQKEALWVEYEHRHKLIVSGQYEEFRTEQFRENYIKGMRRLGMTDKEISQMEELTPREFDMLVYQPDVRKDSTSKTYLPELGLFNYEDKDTLYQVRNKLKEAFKTVLDKDFDYDDVSNIDDKIDKVRKLVKKEDRDQIDDTSSEKELYSSMRLIPSSRIKKSKIDKNGNYHYYIPFLGSEKGKNGDLVKDIVAYKKRIGQL